MDFIARMKGAVPPKLERDFSVARHNFMAGRHAVPEKHELIGYSRDGYVDCFHFDSNFVANSFYGTEPGLKAFANYRGRIKAAIEHGVYFGSTVESEASINPYPAVITYSAVRVSHLRAAFDRLVLPIGPYIRYSKPFLDPKERDSLHEQLGKVMLVYPKHSLEKVKLSADLAETCRQIDALKIERGIDTILVCLYFNDVAGDLPSLFERHGYRVVCCGHRSDPDFLPRQRSLIELADLTVSNSVGTHIGYCHSLGKEHVLLDQVYEEQDFRNGLINLGENHANSRLAEMAEVAAAFSPDGTADLRDEVVNKYWGADLLRTEAELKECFMFFDEIYKRTKDLGRMDAVAREILCETDNSMLSRLANEMLEGCRG